MKAIVTGAAGFIGSNVVDRLLADGATVIGVDNLATGRKRFLERALKNSKFHFERRDLSERTALDGLLNKDTNWVFHFAANADVRDGLLHPEKDVQQNILVTWNILEAMRKADVHRIVFSSTGSIYGEAPVIPTPEDCPFPVQTSLYGASKLAAEGLLSAYAEGYGFKARIFRFVSILGPRYTHGHVFDFVRQLKQNPKKLKILGDGKQKKSYLGVDDCIEAILTAIRHDTSAKIAIYNLGADEFVTVDQSIDVITKELNLQPERIYAGGDRGWVGDNPFIFLKTDKIRALGWSNKSDIRACVSQTVRFLLENPWVYEKEAVSQ